MAEAFRESLLVLLLVGLLAACSGKGSGDEIAPDGSLDVPFEASDVPAEARTDVAPEAAPGEVDATGADPAGEVAENPGEVAEPHLEVTEADEPEEVDAPTEVVEPTGEVAEVADAAETIETDGGETDTEVPPLVSACVDCHTDKATLVALLPEEPGEDPAHGGG